MKVKLIIDKIYKEAQICVCGSERTQDIKELFFTIDSVVNSGVTGFKGDEVHMLNSFEIIQIFTQNQKVYAATQKGEYLLHERLYELEEKLDSRLFIRVSNSDIVNVKKIKSLDTKLAGTIRMQLDGGREAYVSRRYISKIKKSLGI